MHPDRQSMLYRSDIIVSSWNCSLFHCFSTSLSGMGTSKVWFTDSTPHTVGWPMFGHRLIKCFMWFKAKAMLSQGRNTAQSELSWCPLKYSLFDMLPHTSPLKWNLHAWVNCLVWGDLKLDTHLLRVLWCVQELATGHLLRSWYYICWYYSCLC